MDRVHLSCRCRVAGEGAAGPSAASGRIFSAPADAIVGLVKTALADHYKEGQLVLRDAHAKAHGCVKASLQVNTDIKEDLRRGIFKEPGRLYHAWIRFSNGNFTPSMDSSADGRGMAIKLVGIPGPLGQTESESRTHDILMINHPRFFSPDVKDYREFIELGGLNGGFALIRYFFWRPHQAPIAYSIASQKILSPFSTQYYSMTPYKFGQDVAGKDRAIKYSAKPCPGQTVIESTDTKDADYLRKAMVAQLDEQSGNAVCYTLLIQERREEMSIEDATEGWDESKSPFISVATIKIEKQSFDTPARRAICENMSFNPSNTNPDQRGLGGMNRLRDRLYKAISEYRHTRNNAENVDAAKAWDNAD